MKVLFLCDSVGAGGAQNQFTLLAKLAAEAGVRVCFYTYYNGDFFEHRLKHPNIVRIRDQKKGKVGINILLALRQLIQKENFDLIISFLDTPNFYAALLGKLNGKNIPVIVSHRLQTDFNAIGKVDKWCRVWANNNAAWITANSRHEKDNWISHYPHLKNKFSTVYNAIALEKKNTQPLPEKLTRKMIVVGSVSHKKNGLCIIEAMGILKKKNKLNFQLLWVGRKNAGIAGSGHYSQQMDDRIKALNLVEDWVWCGQSDNVSAYYTSSDALILASTIEGLPNVVCEAQFFGLPVLVSNVPDHPLLIKNGFNGFLFDPNQPEELANQILKFYMLSDQQHLELRKNSLKNADDLFSREKFLNAYLALFRKLCPAAETENINA